MAYYYYFKEDYGLIRIRATRKPVKRSKPYSLQEWNGGKFVMPCFPEIPFSNLKKMIYIGKTK
jgi:hypothetical protein